MPKKLQKQENVTSVNNTKQETYQRRIDLTYKSLMTALGIATILAPLYFPPMVYIGGVAMLTLKGIRYLDERKGGAISSWLAKRNDSDQTEAEVATALEEESTHSRERSHRHHHHLLRHLDQRHPSARADEVVVNVTINNVEPLKAYKLGLFGPKRSGSGPDIQLVQDQSVAASMEQETKSALVVCGPSA